jgi:hypothetical protein
MNKSLRVFAHLVVWIALLLLLMYLDSNGKIVYKSVVLLLYFGIINIAVFYINYLFILPTFLNRKKYLWCAVIILSLVIISSFVKCGLAYYFYDIVIKRNGSKYIMDFWLYYSSAAFVSCFFILLSTVLKFIQDWFLNEK